MPSTTEFVIGSYFFLKLDGNVPVYAEVPELIQRPGIDSAVVRRIGKQSPVFSMTSLVNLTTYATARTAMEAYSTLVGAGALAFTMNGLNYANYYDTDDGFNVVVLGVRPVEEQRKACIGGGFVGAGYGFFALRAQWDLMLVRNV